MRWLLALSLLAILGCGAGSDLDPRAPNDVDPEWPEQGPPPPEFHFPPWLTMPEPNRIVVSWRTASPTTGRVRFGSSPRMGAHALSRDPGLVHHVDLGRLPPATAFWYEVLIDDTPAVRRGVFVTPGRDRWRFAQFGEFHAPAHAHEAAEYTEILRSFRPHVIVDCGDMCDDGDDLSNWESYMLTSAPWISNVILLPTQSNHVDGTGGNALLKDLFVLPNDGRWYSTRYGQVQILTLDSTSDILNPDVGTVQPVWLAEETRRAHDGVDDPVFLLSAWHHPACSSHYASREVDRRWVHSHFVDTFLANGGLDLILVGHDKYYERATIDGGIVHVQSNLGLNDPGDEGDDHEGCHPVRTVLTTQSLLLVDVAGSRLSARAVDVLGNELDAFEIVK